MTTKYIEINSGYRNRYCWPCPSEFVIPISCINKDDNPLLVKDAISKAYPAYTWYQVPYCCPYWEPAQDLSIDPNPYSPRVSRPRSINGDFYVSLWPMNVSLDNTLIPLYPGGLSPPNIGMISAMTFSGGTAQSPQLNSVVFNGPNSWITNPSGAGPGIQLNLNPYYTTLSNYFAGATLLKFSQDPSCYLNAWYYYQELFIPAGTAAVVGDGYGQGNGTLEIKGIVVCRNIDGTRIGVVHAYDGIAIPPPPGLPIPPPLYDLSPGTYNESGVYDPTLVAPIWPPATLDVVTSVSLVKNPFEYTGSVEQSKIISYDPSTGAVDLEFPFSSFSTTDYYLIDFNTDPEDKWSDYTLGGPRIFIPGGGADDNTYSTLLIQNYTSSRSSINTQAYENHSIIKSYNGETKIAMLSKSLPLIEIPFFSQSSGTPRSVYGSNSFIFREKQATDTRSVKRLGIIDGSILKFQIKNKGKNYKKGQYIGCQSSTGLPGEPYSLFYNSPSNVAPINTVYPPSGFVSYIISRPGNALVAEITSVDSQGGIIDIKIHQQGQGFKPGLYYLNTPNITFNDGNGKDAVLYVERVYSCLEIYKKNSNETFYKYNAGDLVWLPLLGQKDTDNGLQNNNPYQSSPSVAKYEFQPTNLIKTEDVPSPPLPAPGDIITSFQNLDILNGEYPVRLLGCKNKEISNIYPNTGTVKIVDTLYKPQRTFGNFWETLIAPPDNNTGSFTNGSSGIMVIYLDERILTEFSGTLSGYEIILNPGGIPTTEVWKNIYVPASYQNSNGFSWNGGNSDINQLTSTGFLLDQILEVLPFCGDNESSLNYTGTRVSQNQMVCYEIDLISLTLPNQFLENAIGGLIAFYPYLYVEFSNYSDPNSGIKGVIYSNNPNAHRALFRVNVDDTSTPLISKFIKLDADGGVQTVKFKPNDNLYIRVFLQNGSLFETILKDYSPPLAPDFYLQIGAQFSITRLA